MRDAEAQRQLDSFMSRYTPDIADLASRAIKKMRRIVPSAVQLVYDNYNALVIGFGPTDRAADAIFSIALYPRWVTLFFLKGAGLRDPEKLLRGSGKCVRSIVLEDARTLDRSEIRALIEQAIEATQTPLDGSGPGKLIIKSISGKQRPRRPSKKDQPPLRSKATGQSRPDNASRRQANRR